MVCIAEPPCLPQDQGALRQGVRRGSICGLTVVRWQLLVREISGINQGHGDSLEGEIYKNDDPKSSTCTNWQKGWRAMSSCKRGRSESPQGSPHRRRLSFFRPGCFSDITSRPHQSTSAHHDWTRKNRNHKRKQREHTGPHFSLLSDSSLKARQRRNPPPSHTPRARQVPRLPRTRTRRALFPMTVPPPSRR